MKFYFVLVIILVCLLAVPVFALGGIMWTSYPVNVWVKEINGTLPFNFTYVDDGWTSSDDNFVLGCNLYLDGSNESSGFTTLIKSGEERVTGTIYTNETLREGEHSWSVTCQNESFSITSQRSALPGTFVVDNTPPTADWKPRSASEYGYISKNEGAYVSLSMNGTGSPWDKVEFILKDQNGTIHDDSTCVNEITYLDVYYTPYLYHDFCAGSINTTNFENGEKVAIDAIITDKAGNMGYFNNSILMVDGEPPNIFNVSVTPTTSSAGTKYLISFSAYENSNHVSNGIEISHGHIIPSNSIEIYKAENSTIVPLLKSYYVLLTNTTNPNIFDSNIIQFEQIEYSVHQNNTHSELIKTYKIDSPSSEIFSIDATLDSAEDVVLYFNRTNGVLLETTHYPANESEKINVSIKNATFNVYYPINESYGNNPTVEWRNLIINNWSFSIFVKDVVGNIGEYKSQNISITKDTSAILHGFVTDYYGRPLYNLTMDLSGDNFTTYSITNEKGEYYFENLTYPSDYTIKIPLNESIIDIRNFEVDNKTIVYESIINFDSEKMEYNITLNTNPTSEASVVYYYIKQTADFFNKTLNLVFDYMPVKIYLFGNSGTFYTTPDRIEIDKSNSAVDSTSAPDNRERHEFSHYAMFNSYNMLPPQCGGAYNHRGWENPSTSDSWCEGFAEFIPLVISDYNNESQPWIYSIGSGLDMEVNYEPRDGWPSYHGSEEIAIASLLWDLYDSNKTYALYPGTYDDDDVSISANDMWNVISSKHNFTVYYDGDPEERYIYYVHDLYDAFISSGLANQTDIENIFTAHGFPNGQPDTPFNPGRH